ncbi:MAG: metallophosphoesterase, partial [Candidatus Aminicenantes bacterium]|nr:metallophosphoesterase [Candidatus Aminicenantes bacterium]
PLRAADIPCVWTDVERIVAVGDLHGDYENLVDILKGTGLVDEGLHWAGGRSHLVQTGDIMDRGPDARKILDLLMKLELEAALAGGKVHVLIGNHEMLNIIGIAFEYPGYVTLAQFLWFLPEDFRESREKEVLKGAAADGSDAKPTSPEAAFLLKNYWAKTMKTDKDAQAAYIGAFLEDYGPWFLKKNCIEKINDVVFVHGGVSSKYSTWDLGRINSVLREELAFLSTPVKSPHVMRLFHPQIIYDRLGPLWYRDLAQRDEKEFARDVDQIFANLKARFMVIAHSPQIGSPVAMEFMSRFQKRIWIIDTGITHAFGGRLSALVIDNGQFSVWGEEDE